MKVAVLGTGVVGRTLAERLLELGHTVTVGTRDVKDLMARTETDRMGNPPFATWQSAHAGATPLSFRDAVADADLIINATSGDVTLRVLSGIGAARLGTRVLLDTANPLDFRNGFPPTLSVCNTDSLGEQIQREYPDVRVVKSLNTLTAALMTHPETVGDGDHTVFVAGDDPAAKGLVRELLVAMGHRDVLDVGDITAARGLEMWLPLWLRLMGTVGSPAFNLKIVRAGNG
ncbi:MAG: NAD(P)-binding domain-containing protein [Thermoleophilia bacterium]